MSGKPRKQNNSIGLKPHKLFEKGTIAVCCFITHITGEDLTSCVQEHISKNARAAAISETDLRSTVKRRDVVARGINLCSVSVPHTVPIPFTLLQ